MSSLPSSSPAKRGANNPEIQKIMVRRSSALHEVTKKGIYGDIQRIIDSNPSSIDDIDQFGQTALHIAAFEGYLDIVELLISNGASITLQDKNGWAPLHCAATNGHLDICQRLIIEGADPNAQNSSGSTPLHYLSALPLSDRLLFVLYLMCKKEANISIPNEHGMTPLHNACLRAGEGVVLFLLLQGADPDTPTAHKECAIHIACRLGKKRLVEILIMAGANTLAQGPDGNAEETARRSGHDSLAEFIHNLKSATKTKRKQRKRSNSNKSTSATPSKKKSTSRIDLSASATASHAGSSDSTVPQLNDIPYDNNDDILAASSITPKKRSSRSKIEIPQRKSSKNSTPPVVEDADEERSPNQSIIANLTSDKDSKQVGLSDDEEIETKPRSDSVHVDGTVSEIAPVLEKRSQSYGSSDIPHPTPNYDSQNSPTNPISSPTSHKSMPQRSEKFNSLIKFFQPESASTAPEMRSKGRKSAPRPTSARSMSDQSGSPTKTSPMDEPQAPTVSPTQTVEKTSRTSPVPALRLQKAINPDSQKNLNTVPLSAPIESTSQNKLVPISASEELSASGEHTENDSSETNSDVKILSGRRTELLSPKSSARDRRPTLDRSSSDVPNYHRASRANQDVKQKSQPQISSISRTISTEIGPRSVQRISKGKTRSPKPFSKSLTGLRFESLLAIEEFPAPPHSIPSVSESMIIPQPEYYIEVGKADRTTTPKLFIDDLESTCWYYKDHFFDPKLVSHSHWNFVGYLELKFYHAPAPVIISLIQSDGPVLGLIRTLSGDTTFNIEIDKRKQGTLTAKKLLKLMQEQNEDLKGAKLVAVKEPQLADELLLYEKTEKNQFRRISSHKIGIIYVKEGQITEEEILGNKHGSERYEQFLSCIGEKIELKDWEGFDGGLDTKKDRSGKYSIFTTWSDFEVMFHVSTYLPLLSGDEKYVERKKHIANDMTTIVFLDAQNTAFKPPTLSGDFLHTFVIVQPKEDGKYMVSVAARRGIPEFGPALPPHGLFELGDSFREFLLSKVINAERAALVSPMFITKRRQARQQLLSLMINKYNPPK